MSYDAKKDTAMIELSERQREEFALGTAEQVRVILGMTNCGAFLRRSSSLASVAFMSRRNSNVTIMYFQSVSGGKVREQLATA